MSERICPPALEAHFQALKATPSDINEHLDLLREYASRCDRVTEFGMRGANGSTVAFLAAQPKSLISWDVNPGSIVSQAVMDLLIMNDPRQGARTYFQPRCGNTLTIAPIEETDFLFIDTLHTFKQLDAELDRHCVGPLEAPWTLRRVRKYIGFHDTITFGLHGEDGTHPGLRTAIWHFQKNAWPLWKVVEDRENNNGLVILERVYAD